MKLSSLGDVVHAMPALQDIRRALPDAQIDWVVEEAFAPLVARCEGLRRAVPCALRRWRKSFWAAGTRREWRAFKTDVQVEAYDAVIDLQGLAKSALVARLANLAPGGKRYAMANRTDGSSYEAPTRWVADVAIRLEPHLHAVERSRRLCAAALGFETPNLESYGLKVSANPSLFATKSIAFVVGSSRADKCWPAAHWCALGERLRLQGFAIRLVHGNDAEERVCQALADALSSQPGPDCTVLPRLGLPELADRLAASAGVIGVDSGVSHIAVALGLPHVQIYNFDTAWRTGPQGNPQQTSVFASPAPDVDAVWQAWLVCQRVAGTAA